MWTPARPGTSGAGMEEGRVGVEQGGRDNDDGELNRLDLGGSQWQQFMLY